MAELTIVGVIIGALTLLLALPPLYCILIGALIVIGGLSLAALGGVGYHVQLYRVLARYGEPPTGLWFFRPSRYHDRLQPPEDRTVRRWYTLGSTGFVATMFGFLTFVVGGLRAL